MRLRFPRPLYYADGGPVCKDGVWMEADLQRLMRNEINPEVRSGRAPPASPACVRCVCALRSPHAPAAPSDVAAQVQCFRKPPCIRWSYLSTENCALCVAPLAPRRRLRLTRGPGGTHAQHEERRGLPDLGPVSEHDSGHAGAPARGRRCAVRFFTAARARAAQTMRSVVEDFLVNKTVFFVGDSINGLVYQAAVRWLALSLLRRV